MTESPASDRYASPYKLVVFAGRAAFAQACIARLLRHGVVIDTLVVDGFYYSPNAATQALAVDSHGHSRPWYSTPLTNTTGQPVRVVGIDDRRAMTTLNTARLTHLVSVCFPRRITRQHCRLASRGAYNLHPSRLPRYRGPAPVFWQLRDGELSMGLSVHHITEQLDAGPVVWQSTIDCQTPLTGDELNQQFAHACVTAIQQVLSAPRTTPRVQDDAQASWQPWPVAADFELPPGWSCLHALRFIRGTLHWHMDYAHPAIGGRVSIVDAQLAPVSERDVSIARRRLPFRDGAIDIGVRHVARI